MKVDQYVLALNTRIGRDSDVRIACLAQNMFWVQGKER